LKKITYGALRKNSGRYTCLLASNDTVPISVSHDRGKKLYQVLSSSLVGIHDRWCCYRNLQ